MSDTAPKITVKFLSDWHIGSGTGRTGDVDRLVRRDRYHTPFVPGKTITGILRDACERVAHALDSDSRTTAAESETTENPTWTDWVTFLFGNHPKPGAIIPPAPAHLHISSAHLPTELRKAIANKPALQSALTFVKPGVKIDSVSGTAEDKHFRLVEMARGGISLQASYSLEGLKDATEEQMAAQALLVAGAAVVERMGSKRRRGAGRCTLSIGSFSLKQALKTLQDNSVPPAPPDSQPKPTTEAYADDSVTEKGWTTIPVTLVTQQPVIISKGTVGNVVQSLDYIPGTHLLPIVARHLGSQGVDVREAIAKSHLIITNALPSIDGRATAPTPFAWFYEKQTSNLARALGNGEKQRTYLNATNKLWGEPEDGKQRKQFRGSYITPEFVTDSTTADSKAVERVEVSLGIETHNTVDDTSQRPTSDVGGVYSYQAIPIGTKLRAELRLHPALCAQLKGEPKQWFASLHQQTHSVGVSRKDEYGNLRLEIGQPVLTKELSTSEQKSDCVDSSKTDSSELENSKVLVWLTSDLLLRNQWLQPTSRVEDLLQALTEALQLPAGSLTELPF
ncbi:MAG: RAMP superfamily CRISPR-associated protein, partial [Cyanobacteria bacterium P01_G01_bin.4]